MFDKRKFFIENDKRELKMRILKTHPLLSIINGMLIDLPAPSNLSYFWGFGSLLGLVLVIQLATGGRYSGETGVRSAQREAARIHAKALRPFQVCPSEQQFRRLWLILGSSSPEASVEREFVLWAIQKGTISRETGLESASRQLGAGL